MAACTKRYPILGLGLDVEPLEPLKPGVERYIQTEAETARLEALSPRPPERLIFSAKESLYKCFYPLMKRFFGFHSVEIQIDPERRSFDFKPTDQARRLFPGDLGFHGRFAITETHLITGCYLLPKPGKSGQPVPA